MQTKKNRDGNGDDNGQKAKCTICCCNKNYEHFILNQNIYKMHDFQVLWLLFLIKISGCQQQHFGRKL